MSSYHLDFTDPQSRVLELLNVSISSVSICCSIFIITCFIKFQDLRTFAFWLVFKTATCDVFYSIGLFLGDAGGNADTHLGASSGLCYLQALLISYFGLASLLWSVSIAFTLHQAFLLEKEEYSPQNVSNFRHRYMIVCWGVPVLLTLLPISTMSYGDAGGWCWIVSDKGNHLMWRFFQFYLWMWLAICYNAYVFRRIEQKLKRLAAEVEGGVKASGMARRLRLYPLVLAICHGPGFVASLYEIFGSNAYAFYIITVIEVFFAASLGIFDALIYGLTPEIKARVCQRGRQQSQSHIPEGQPNPSD